MEGSTVNDTEREATEELQQQWHGWGSPGGVGIGLLCVGEFWKLIR